MTKIDKKILDKNFDFTVKFSTFLVHNPEVAKKIPNNACVVFKDSSDHRFTSANVSIAKKAVEKGEVCISATPEKNTWRLEQIIHA